ncbi:MAG: ABC transporter ATP-binding protein [bacterium]|nr:ABC transporter ATP-binding protein [bacterium]
MAILKTENLKAYYITEIFGVKRTVRAVDGVSVSINNNEIFGIAGESGCGKSTLIKTLLGIVKPPLTVLEGGVNYSIGDKKFDILALNQKELKSIRWEYISYIPQSSMSVLNPVRRIRDSFKSFINAHKKIEKEEFKNLVEEHLNALGLPTEVLNAYPHQLSGGMRQRVTIALATILRPKVIFADEPSTALDVVVQRGVIQLLKDIQQEQKNTVILVTHDMAIHANICDRIAIMYAGKIIEEAKTEEIFKNPLHPYTKYLIGSLPKIGDKSYRVSAPGSPPPLTNLPPGCSFHPRCPYTTERCKREFPKLVEVADSHKVACFLVSKEV